MTQDDIIAFVTGLPGVVAVTADEASGAPEVAWGDSFFYYDPDGDPAGRRMPFATIVTKDYDALDAPAAIADGSGGSRGTPWPVFDHGVTKLSYNRASMYDIGAGSSWRSRRSSFLSNGTTRIVITLSVTV